MKKAWLIILLSLLVASCAKKEENGFVDICVDYSVNNEPLITDTLCYHNEAGNEFLITEIQWFVSKWELQDEQGRWIASDRIFYIDTNIPESQILRMDSIPIGKYKKVRFTFGLDESDNLSGRFSDPPESNMFWPEPLGGGYHYMKLNGKFVNEAGQLVPLNIHLGRLHEEDNHFVVELPIDFIITESTENQLHLTMIIDNWFRSPNLYDFNEYGSAIMQNPTAQRILKENGNDVFKIQNIEKQNNMNTKKEDILKGFSELMQKATPKPHFWRWESTKERMQKIQDSKFKI